MPNFAKLLKIYLRYKLQSKNPDLLRRFNLLDRVEKDVLKVLATCYEGVSLSHFHKILKTANIYDAQGRTLTQRDLERIVFELNEKQWIRADNLSTIYCLEEYERFLVKMASEDNRFPLFVMALSLIHI